MSANVWLSMLRSGEPLLVETACENISKALESANGSVPAVAEALGCSERTAYRLIGAANLSSYGACLRRSAGLRDTRNANLWD